MSDPDPNEPTVTVDPTPEPTPAPAPELTPPAPTDAELLDVFHAKKAAYEAAKTARESVDAVLAAAVSDQAAKLAAEAQAKQDADAAGEGVRAAVAAEEP